jgi:hypothetical protein
MIHVLLQGRTGNNLFQYAVGRHLAIRHKTDLELDISWMGALAVQMRELERLPIAAKIVRRWSPVKKAIRQITGIGPEAWHRGAVYRESGNVPGFLPEVLEQPDGVLLIGFFLNERYFSDIETELRAELSMDDIQLVPSSMRTLDAIQARPTVSLHVRRGDYLKISATQCVDDNYHVNACRYLRERYSNLEFLIFSDDIPWCRRHFTGEEFRFCDHPDHAADPFHDLKLMASCAHHIVANSSYSWWGAWLNPSRQKTIVAPKMWMKGVDSSKVTPQSWILL